MRDGDNPGASGPSCGWCEEPVLGTDERAPNYQQPMHYECGLRAALGSLGHQRKRCSCYGGAEEDPSGMTRRQAAVAAAMYFHLGRLPDNTINHEEP
jgi:hypothetical protein